jgi:hypothetical protein
MSTQPKEDKFPGNTNSIFSCECTEENGKLNLTVYRIFPTTEDFRWTILITDEMLFCKGAFTQLTTKIVAPYIKSFFETGTSKTVECEINYPYDDSPRVVLGMKIKAPIPELNDYFKCVYLDSEKKPSIWELQNELRETQKELSRMKEQLKIALNMLDSRIPPNPGPGSKAFS